MTHYVADEPKPKLPPEYAPRGVPTTLTDVAGLLAAVPVSRRTLYNLRQRGMPHIVLPGGRRVLYDLAAVLAWLRRHERGGAQ